MTSYFSNSSGGTVDSVRISTLTVSYHEVNTWQQLTYGICTCSKNLPNSNFHCFAQLGGTTTIENLFAVGIALIIAIIDGRVFPRPGGSPIKILRVRLV